MDTMYKVNRCIENSYAILLSYSSELMTEGFTYDDFITVKYDYAIHCVLYTFPKESVYWNHQPMFQLRYEVTLRILQSLYSVIVNDECNYKSGYIKLCKTLKLLYRTLCKVTNRPRASVNEHYTVTEYIDWLFDRIFYELDCYNKQLESI